MLKIQIKRLIKQTGTKKTRFVIGEIETTQIQVDELAKLYLEVVRVWQNGARDRILPAYQRTLDEQPTQDGMTIDRVEDLQTEIETINAEAVALVLQFARKATEWGSRLVRWHVNKFVSKLKYATNVDLSTMIGPADSAQTLEAVIAENVNLVANVSDVVKNQIAGSVFRGITNRTATRDIAREIAKSTGLARDRSLRIASDQTVKLSTTLDKERQTQLGATEFIWRHSGKVRFRPEHKARNGKQFAWNSDVGKNDPPGRLPYCGCKSKMVLNLENLDDG